MTKTELIKKIILEAFYYVKAYLINYLYPIIKETLIETKEKFSDYIKEIKDYFIEAFWNKIKNDIHEHLEMGIYEANTFFTSASYEEKEEIVVNYILEHIHLPLLLRPSKIIAKKILKKKIREFISDKLENLQKFNQVI